jgi:cytochrome c553
MKRLLLIFIAVVAANVCGTAWAGVEEGKAKAQVCAACHGADGNSPSPVVPSIAGQPKQFIVTALYMFREGRRVSALMAPFAEKLSNADLNDLAAWYSSLKLAAPTKKPNPENVALGKAISEKNNCVACHTATLVGQQHIPRLAGQHYDYLLDQLKLFKASTRGDFDGTMTSAAQALTPADIEALAQYLSTLVAP